MLKKPVQPDSTPRKALTLKDIAAYCRVGKVTVSRALNNAPEISEATRARILAAAEALGYTREQHEAARRLALRKSGQRFINHIVAMIFPDYYHQAPYFQRLSHGVQDALTAQHYAMLTVTMSPGTGGESPVLPPIFTRGEVDGAIIANMETTYDQLLRVSPGFAGHPLVYMIRQHPDGASVVADDCRGAYLATQHLLALGHRHLLYFTAGGIGDIYGQREEGMRQALLEYGLAPAQHLHYCPWVWLGPLMPAHARLPLAEYLADDPHGLYRRNIDGFLAQLRAQPGITAILAPNDAMALHIWHILLANGLRVPDDYSLVGFGDDLAKYDDDGHNLLTTVQVPLEEIGRQATTMLLAMIAGTPAPATPLRIPTSLTIRASTTRPRTDRSNRSQTHEPIAGAG